MQNRRARGYQQTSESQDLRAYANYLSVNRAGSPGKEEDLNFHTELACLVNERKHPGHHGWSGVNQEKGDDVTETGVLESWESEKPL